jgi:hypothetical protein
MSDDDPEILRPVLARFAAGWGASVDCEKGLVADLRPARPRHRRD